MSDPSLRTERQRYAALIFALLLATGMLLYVRRVLVPYQRADAAAYDHPRGYLSDLYPRWLGARELLLHGRDPYGPEITREIQLGYYGRAIDPSRPGDSRDQQAFAYPVYVVFLLAPAIFIPFKIVHPVFFVVLIFLTGFTVIWWLRALRWNLPKTGTAILILLALGNIPAIQGIELQQLTLVVAAMLAACAVLLVNGKFTSAGILLAICTIKPQLSLPVAAWLTLWAASEWRRRKGLVFGFLIALGILLAGAQWLLPGWTREFWHAGQAYLEYTNASSLVNNLTGPRLGALLSVAISLVTIFVCWRLRRESEKSLRFVFAIALILATTLAVIPVVASYNQVLLLPGLLFLLSQTQQVRSARLLRPLCLLAFASICWPWVAALGLAIASFILPAARVQQGWALPFYTGIMPPLVILGLLLQYSFEVLRPGDGLPLAPNR